MTKDTKEFKRYIGEILTIALDVESYLEYFISNYFTKEKNRKTFFFKDIILLNLTFENKINIFKKICEKEKFDKKEISEIIKSIRFVQHTRNKVAHWEAERRSENIIQLRKRTSYTTTNDILKVDKNLVEKADEERSKAIKGITKFYLIYHKIGPIDEKGSVGDF